MPGITAEQALQDLQALTNPTVQDIKDKLAEVNAAIPTGKTAIFNSGPIATGTASYDAVNALKSSDSSLASVGDTQMHTLLNSENTDFQSILQQAVDHDNSANNTNFTADDILNGTTTGGSRNPDGLWDIASTRYAEDATGNVRVIAFNPNMDSVFMQSEIPALQNNSNITSFNNVPKSNILAGDMFKNLAETSALQIVHLDGGADILVNAGYDHFIRDLGSNSLLRPVYTSLDFLDGLPKPVVILVLAGVALFDAGQALAAGNTEEAAEIIVNFVVEEAEGGISYAIAAGLVTSFIALLAVASLTIPALLGGALVLAAGVAGTLVIPDLIEAYELTRMFGIADDDPRVVNYVLDGQNTVGVVNDIYVAGYHVYGNDGISEIFDFTPNLIQGVDTITGTDEDDLILGGINDDLLIGDIDDTTNGVDGVGIDTIIGGEGQDTIIGSEGEGEIIDGGAGYDWVNYSNIISADGEYHVTADLRYSGTTPNVHLDFTGPDNDDQTLYSIEAIRTGSGEDTITGNFYNNIIMSGSDNDSVNGWEGDDELQGGSGRDILDGWLGNDVLYGQGGNDTLYGDDNNDVLIGGAEDDWLEGGSNSDIYWFGIADGEDTIRDSHGADRIWLYGDKIEMSGEAELLASNNDWKYVLHFGEDANNDDVPDYTAYLNWDTNNASVPGAFGDLEIDFDATFYYDVIIENFTNGEFGIRLEDGAVNVNVDDGEAPADIIFNTLPRTYSDYAGDYGPAHIVFDPLNEQDEDELVIMWPWPAEEEDPTETSPYAPIQIGTPAGPSAPWDPYFPDLPGVALPHEPLPTLPDDPATQGAISVGDPHLLTFDGKFYDFQDAGEFTLVQSTDANAPFTIQSRQKSWDLGDATGEMFSVNSAIATQLGDYSVGFYLPGSLPYDLTAAQADEFTLNDTLPVLYVGNYPVFMANNSIFTIEGFGSVYRHGDSYMVVNSTLDYFTVNIHDTHIDFASGLSATRTSGTLEGLLGNGDGDASNDFMLDDGTDLGETITADVLYNTFGEDWRITQGESLFLYGSGETTSSFDNPNFDHALRTLDNFDPAIVATAEAAVIAEGFDPTSDVFDAAVLDYLVMGDIEHTDMWEALEARSVTQALIEDYSGFLIEGTSADDAIYGTPIEDYIIAHEGDDTVYGDGGDDTIVGGAGDDSLYGEDGNDTYIHNLGDGNDHLFSGEYLSYDAVIMNGTSSVEDIYFTVSGNDLLATNKISGETLRLDNMYNSTGKTFATVNDINVWGNLTVYATDNSDVAHASEFNDTLYGGTGDDLLYGDDGDDVLYGDAGEDTLYGQDGDDTFIHHYGDGSDHLYSGEYNSNDVVFMYDSLGGLLAEEDMQFIVTSRDLEIVNRDNGESITLDNQYYSSGNTFATINGIDITGGLTLIGTDNNDDIDGTDFNDTIEAGLGNDTIDGQDGDDTYIHREGDGNDHIYSGEYNSSDIVLMYDSLGGLIAEEDLQFVVGSRDLSVVNRTNGETLTLDNMYYSSGKTIASVNGIDITGAMSFVGTDATEVINATDFNDTIEGGLGNDTIYGENGDDVYIHNFGDGNDHLLSGEYNSNDVVFMYDSLGGLIAEEDLLFTVFGYDLRVEDRDSGEYVILDNQYYSSGESFAFINNIAINGGLNIVATDDAETFYGTDFDDTLEGGGGDDIIYGEGGDDTYIHHRGDGNDHLLSGEYNSLDAVYMYDDNNTLIAEADLQLIVSGYDLIVKDRISGETVTLDNLYYSAGNTFATINGIDMSGGINSVGTSAGESIYGTEYADTLEGAGGTDYVYGGAGQDTFIHHEGDGNDYLFNTGYNQSDEIFMFDDLDMQIVEADLMFTQSGNDMIVTHTENSETLVLDNFFYSQGNTFGTLNGIDLDTVI